MPDIPTTLTFLYGLSQTLFNINTSLKELKPSFLFQLILIIQIGTGVSLAYLNFNQFSYIKNIKKQIDGYLYIARKKQTKIDLLKCSSYIDMDKLGRIEELSGGRVTYKEVKNTGIKKSGFIKYLYLL